MIEPLYFGLAYTFYLILFVISLTREGALLDILLVCFGIVFVGYLLSQIESTSDLILVLFPTFLTILSAARIIGKVNQ